jgi:hypothetical protein
MSTTETDTERTQISMYATPAIKRELESIRGRLENELGITMSYSSVLAHLVHNAYVDEDNNTGGVEY